MENLEKVNVVVLPTQQGKTFAAINEIVSTIENILTKNYLHIVFTMNTILNNRQFSGRLEVIEQKYGKNSIVEFNSSNINENNHVSSLVDLKHKMLNNDKPYVIIVCTNGKRIKDISLLLESFNDVLYYEKVNLYFDEIHKYIDKLRPLIEDAINYTFVNKIIGLTATPRKIWNVDWVNIKIYETKYDDTNYISLKDHEYELIDFFHNYEKGRHNDYDIHEKNIFDFAKECFIKFPEIIDKKSRTFIPSHVRLSSHYEMKELIINYWPDSVVVILNGREKSITFLNDNIEYETIPFSKNKKETSEEIVSILDKYCLRDRPLFITGFLCIGMGQTLVNESLGPFTHAIISHMDLFNDEIYQLLGRTTGRMKHWKSYVKTKIFIPKTTIDRAIAMQDCALNMINYMGKMANKNDYNMPLNELPDEIKNNVQDKIAKHGRLIATEANCIIPIKIEIESKDDINSRPKFTDYLQKNLPDFYETIINYKIHLHGFRVNDDYMKKSFKTVITAYNEKKYVIPPGKHSAHNNSNHIFVYLNPETNLEAYICIWKN